MRVTPGLWRSLVARLLWEQEVVGSSPTSPTIIRYHKVVKPNPPGSSGCQVVLFYARSIGITRCLQLL